MKMTIAVAIVSLGAMIAALFRAHGRLPDELINYLLEGINETLSRIVVVVAFSVVVFIQLGIASEVYPDRKADAFLFDIMGATTSIWELLMLMLAVWASVPLWVKIISLVYRIKVRGHQVTTEEYWSETA